MNLPNCRFVLVDIPAPGALLVTMNLPHQMNALPVDAYFEMDRLWKWFDEEQEFYESFSLKRFYSDKIPRRVGIVIGAGKSFSAGRT
jgi:enoyl-CoA hydratase/carnithine racemase